MIPVNMLDTSRCGAYGLKAYYRCIVCGVVGYCDTNHEMIHLKKHADQCRKICTILKDFEEGKHLLAEGALGVMNTAKQATKSACLEMWGSDCYNHFIDYVFTRFTVLFIIGKAKTLKKVESEYGYLRSFFALFSGSPETASREIPRILLENDRCDLFFDLVRQTIMRPSQGSAKRSGEDYALQYVDNRGIDAFKGGYVFCANLRQVSYQVSFIHAIYLTLVKINIIRDLEIILSETRRALGRFVPEEVLNKIQYYVAGTNVVANCPHFSQAEYNAGPINVLKGQVDALFLQIDSPNELSWPYLPYGIKPVDQGIKSDRMWPEFADEMTQKYSHIWLQTPGAMGIIADTYIRLMPGSDENGKIREHPVPRGQSIFE